MGFATPDAWAEEYFIEESKRYAQQQFIEDEMSRLKNEAVKRFYILSHPNYAEQVATTTAFGYTNQLPEAEKIVNKLCLSDKHIAALLNDEEMMNKIIFQEKIEEKMMGEIIFDDDKYDYNLQEHCYC